MGGELILVADDDGDLRRTLASLLRVGGLKVAEAEDGDVAVDLLQKLPVACVVTDVRMPRRDGFGVLEFAREHRPDLPVLLLTAHGDLDDAVRAIGEGAFDYLPKPIETAALRRAVARALEQRQARRQVTPEEPGEPGDVVGSSPAMVGLYNLVARAAAADTPVMIRGETGSGKEWVARAIHRLSERRRGPFVSINCSALAEGTLESELFGHVRGSFTGATGARKGLFQLAHGGVLLFDEVSELPPRVQGEVLRVLQSGEVRPLGADEGAPVDVRVVCSTWQDLDRLVAEGRFREDLLFRLRVIEIVVPPLRDRAEDILPLATHFLHLVAPSKRFAPETVTELERRPWPGNVRELRTAIERAAALSPGPVVFPSDLPPVTRHHEPPARSPAPSQAPPHGHGQPPSPSDHARMLERLAAAFHDVLRLGVLPLDEVERAYVRAVVEHLQGNKTQAGEALGVDRKTIRRVLSRGSDGPDDQG